MKAKIESRPICRYCAKAIPIETNSAMVHGHADGLDDLTPEQFATARGIDPDRITKVHRHTGGRVWCVDYWTGRFGPEGNDLFCSQRHGFLWASLRAPIVPVMRPASEFKARRAATGEV